MKLSCSSWSHRRAINDGKLTQLSWLELCASQGFDGVELLRNHFPETSMDYLKTLKRRCSELFLTIAMVSAGGHLSVDDDDERAEQISQIRQWVEVAAFLGAPRVRFFCGSGDEIAAGGEELYKKVCDAVREVANIGEEHGIIMSLENHGGTTADQVLQLYNDVNSPYLKFTLDVGNFPPTSHVGPETYTSIERCAPFASIVHAKFFELNEDGSDSEFDWEQIYQILCKAKFNGFLSVEYEGSDPDEIPVVEKIVNYLKKFR